MDKLYTAEEVAEHFGIKVGSLYRWVDLGRIEITRTPGKTIRFTEAQIVGCTTVEKKPWSLRKKA